MRAPTPSEPKSTFPTYQVPQESAMRGSAPPVQVARAAWGGRADPPSPTPCVPSDASSVISGSTSCCSRGNSNIRMQSVTENCLLNSVTVPKTQRIDHGMVAHNNSSKLDSKFGALPPGRDIPNKKSDDLEELLDDLNALKFLNCDTTKNCDNNDDMNHDDTCHLHRLKLKLRTNDNDTAVLDTCEDLAIPLRLRGGGESSLSTGTSGWGTPPSQQASNTNGNKGNTNGQQPPTSQSSNTGWGQPGTKPTANNSMPPAAQPATSAANTQNNNGPSSNTKQQLEQLNSMREAIFSQDGWGGQHVNQDTNWDIPSSPEPPMKMDGSGGPPPWKPAVNNGTELWEANLRNGGQPPPQPQQKTPWGHTPSTNIGGTWGEDDDTDSSNVWTGVPSNQQQWGAGGNTNNGAMWGGPKKENDWGAGAGNSGWGDPRSADPRQAGMDPREIRPELRDIRAGNSDPMRLLDPREQMRQMAGSDMRGDPRGITGRLNGAGAEAFWGQAAPHAAAQQMHHHNKMPVGPANTAGWEEPSPPSQRRNMPNYDDGTSLWGNPQQGSHWKDLPTGASMGRGNAAGPPGMAQNRMKPDSSVWGHARNGSWDEPGPTASWDETGPWPKPKMPGPLWDNDLDWSHKQANKPQLTKEIVWNSKQFRMLVDMGYKKEDVENALRMRDMNMEDALDILSPMRNNRDAWGSRHDDHYDHPPFAGQRFPPGPRRKKWRERKSVISVVLIILFVVLLTAVIMVWKLRSFIREEICTTKECVESAHLFLELIGRDTDPCSNFYNFTCRGYKGDLIVRNLQNAVDKKVKALITGDIEDDDSKSVKTQKKYYLACMDLASIEEDQDETLKNIFRKLGDWPVLTGEKWNETEFHWDKIIEKCQDNGLYYDWFISIDKADDENRLKVSPPDNTNEIEINLMQAYVDLMTKVVRKLGAPGNLSNISESMREVMMFEIELSKIIQTSHDDDDAELSLDDIIRRFPETPWYSIFKHVVLPEHEKIIFNVDIYLSKLQGLLERTQYRVQANYIFWKLIEPFSAFFTRSIRKEFETYAHLSRRYSYPNNRQEYCYSITSTVFAYVSEAEYVRKHAADVKAIQDMVARIKSVLFFRLGNADWMSQSDKSLAFFKLKTMLVIIGGPEEMYDVEEFDKLLGVDQINISHLNNTVEIICEVDKMRDRYNLNFDKPMLDMDLAQFYQASVNLGLTKYLPDENIMFLPAAALDGVFYSRNRPNYLNYGALGNIIAHELVHGFGIGGNSVYKNGKRNILWTNYTYENFLSAAECLLENCNDIGIESNFWMNCKSTFEESFADYVGVNLSYEAYKKLQQEIGEEKSLPGLEYGSAQLFWIIYASLMCNNVQVNSTDSYTHLLPFQRVVGAFRNTEYFARDFNCAMDTNMNPAERCKIL